MRYLLRLATRFQSTRLTHSYSGHDNLISLCDLDRQNRACDTSLHSRADAIATTSHHTNGERRRGLYGSPPATMSTDIEKCSELDNQNAASIWKGSAPVPGVTIANSDLATMLECYRSEKPDKIQRRMDKSRPLLLSRRSQQHPADGVMPRPKLPANGIQPSNEKLLEHTKHLAVQADYQHLRAALLNRLRYQDNVANAEGLLEIQQRQKEASFQREKWLHNLQPHERLVCRATMCHAC